jgi:hypothetical protein
MKSDTTTQYIKTLNYGFLPIRYNEAYLHDGIIDIIEESNSENIYEVRQNQNGKLVAVLSK